MLITEALAELKTIVKRIEKKREYVRAYTTRYEGMKDPLEKDGGSPEVIKREVQAIHDLLDRIVEIRTGIQRTNLETSLTVEGVTRSIAEWLTWRKECSDGAARFISNLRTQIASARQEATRRGQGVVQAGLVASAPTDLVVNVSEGTLADDAELLEKVLGNLDGALSVINATTHVIGI